MTRERWATVKDILARALEQDRTQREAFVDRMCASDELLRREVYSLLAHEDRASSLLGRPLVHSALNLWNGVRSSLRSPARASPATRAPTGAGPPESANSPRRHPFFWLVCAIAVVFVILYAHSARTIYRYGNATKDFGWSSTRSPNGWKVSRVDPAGPAAEVLRKDDEIIALNGDERAAVVGDGKYRRFLSIDRPYTLRIRRQSREEHDYTLPVAVRQIPHGALIASSYVVLSMCFCLMALTMGLSRPQDRLPRLGCLAGFLSALPSLGGALRGYWGLDEGMAFALSDAVWLPDQLYLALGYHFFLQLSYPSVAPPVWVRIRTLLYVVCSVQVAVNLIIHLAGYAGQETAVALAYQYPLITDLHHLLFRSFLWVGLQVVAYAAICAVITQGYRQSRSLDHRRRIAWVVFGALLGLGPVAAYFAVTLVLQMSGIDYWNGPWGIPVGHFVSGCLLAVPTTMAYAVVKHRVLNIRVVVRRTLQYVLARRMLQAVILLPLFGFFWPLIANPNRPVSEVFQVESLYRTSFLLVPLVLGLKYRHRLRTWLDRRFFRDAYHQERLLADLAGEIKGLDTLQEVAAMVGAQVSAALHPSFMCVYQRQHATAPLLLCYSSLEIAEEVSRLAADRITQFSGTRFESPQEVLLPSVTRPEDSEVALLMPINDSSGRLMGVLLLGGKKSEEPYDAADRHLLQGVTNQMAVAHENVWLRERMGEEQRLRKDVFGHLAGGNYNLLLECPACGACFDAGATVCVDDGAELTHFLPVERIVADRYRFDRRLGSGGMGAVYEATDLHLQRKVAAKVMLGCLFGNRSVLRRFEQEAHAVARLNHPNIAAVHDFGRIGTDGAYLIMERVYGSTWRSELTRRSVLSCAVVADWLEQLLDGLEAAHSAGVIHRDLKPENILVVPAAGGGARIKIVDFGLARLEMPESAPLERLTQQGAVMGTLGYMSPEQLKGQTCDARSDVFAVAVIAVESITGTAPFVGNSPQEMLDVIERQELRLEASSAAMRRLAEALRQCLHVDASKRCQSVAQMRDAVLEPLRACTPAGESQECQRVDSAVN